MGDLGELWADLGVDTSGLRQAEGAMRSFDQTAESVFTKAQGHAKAFGGHLMALVGISLSVGAALAFVKRNVEAISDTNLKQISGAAMMLSRETINGIEEQQAAYSEYKSYIKDMYAELNKETANHFASGKEMIGTFNSLVQMGIYASRDEAKSIGVVTDAVKLLHNGYVDQATVMHEIRGLLEGHAGMRYKLAQQLSTMIGPEWKEQVRLAAQEGTLLTFLEEKYKGLGIAAGDIQKQLSAQMTTMDTLIGQIGKGGVQGLYEDIVVLVSQFNDLLRENKDEIIAGMVTGWANVHSWIEKSARLAGKLNSATSMEIPNKPQDRTLGQKTALGIRDTFDPINWANALLTTSGYLWEEFWKGQEQAGRSYMELVDKAQLLLNYIEKTAKMIENSSWWTWAIDTETTQRELADVKSKVSWLIDIFSKIYTWVIDVKINNLPSWLGGGKGPTMTTDQFMETSVKKGSYTIPWDPTKYEDNLKKQQGLTRQYIAAIGREIEVQNVDFQKKFPWKPALGAERGGKGGGKGEDAEMRRLLGMYDSLNRDIARLSEGSWAEIEANALRTINQIYKKDTDRAVTTAELEQMVNKRTLLLKEEAQRKFDAWYAKESGDTFSQIDREMQEMWKNSNKSAETAAKIQEVWNKRYADQFESQARNADDIRKSALQALAQATPFLSEQLALERKILEIDLERDRLETEKKIRDRQIPKYLADEVRGLKAFEAQAKRNNLEMEKARGYGAWAFGRQKEIGQRDEFKDMMAGLESRLSDTWGQAMVDGLEGKKTDLGKLWKDIMADAMKWSIKKGITDIFDFLAGGGKGGGMGGFGGFGGGARPAFGQATPESTAVASQWAATSQKFDQTIGKYDAATGQYSAASTASQGASMQSMVANMGLGFSAASLGLSAIGLLTGSQFLMQAAMVLQIVGTLLQAAAMIMMASSAIPFFHGGGVVGHGGNMVYAHAGYPPPRAGEVDIRVLEGERVLSIPENRAYEAGLRMGGGSSKTQVKGGDTFNLNYSPNYDRRPTAWEMRRDARRMYRTAQTEKRNRN